MTTEKRKPGRPKATMPIVKRSLSFPIETLVKIDKDRGDVSRSKFLLNRAGYGGKP